MDLSRLLALLLVRLVELHELLVAKILDLFPGLLSNLAQVLKAEFTGLLALSARLTLGVLERAFTLEAGDVLVWALPGTRALLAGFALLVDFSALALVAVEGALDTLLFFLETDLLGDILQIGHVEGLLNSGGFGCFFASGRDQALNFSHDVGDHVLHVDHEGSHLGEA